MSRYSEIESPWGRLGYVCIPSGPDKSPVVGGWGDQPWAGRGIIYPRGMRYHSVGARFPTDDEFQIWDGLAREAGDHPRALLLPASGHVPLVVIDIDDPRWTDWALETYGTTPMRVTTGREGGGVHLYYRMPSGAEIVSVNGVVGPDEAVRQSRGTTPIDIKGARGYVVAAGSFHGSGRRYNLLWEGQVMDAWDLTRDHLRQLPVLDVEVHAQQLALGEARKAARKAAKRVVRAVSNQPPPRNSVVKKYVSPVTGGVDASTPITSTTGGTFALGSAPPGRYHSPFRTDSNPSCDIWAPPGGRRLQLCDWSTGERWWIGELVASNAHVVNQPPREKSDVNKIRSSPTEGVPAYLPDGALRSTARLVCTAAPQGTGKTRRLANDVVKPSIKTGGTVLAITHRRTLATILSGRLGVEDYQASTGNLEPTAGLGHAVCLDSLARCPTYRRQNPESPVSEVEDHHHQAVILDEAVSVIAHLFGGTVSKRAGITKTWRQLRAHVQGAAQVVLSDADLGRCPHVVDVIRDMMGNLDGDEMDWIQHDVPPSSKTALQYPDIDGLVESMIEAVGKGQAIWTYSTTRSDATATHERLQTAHPDKTGLLITVETIADDEVRDVLSDPAKADAYDWIVASPSCATAWSYDGDHFDRVYAIGRGFRAPDGGPGATAFDVFQGVRRIRKPQDSTLRFWVGGDICSMPTDPKVIADELLRASRRTGKLVGFDVTDPDHPRIVRDYARVLATRARWGAHLHDYQPHSDEHDHLDKAARLAAKEAKKATTEMYKRHRRSCDLEEWAETSRSDKEQIYRSKLAAEADRKYLDVRETCESLQAEAERLRTIADAAQPEMQKGALTEYLELVGYTISVTDALTSSRGEQAEVKETIREREAIEVAAAPSIQTVDADEILDTDKVPVHIVDQMRQHIAPNQPASVPNSKAVKLAQKAATRRRIEDFYEVEPTAALVRRDDNGRYRSQCRRFVYFELIRDGKRDDIEILDRDEALQDPVRCRHRIAWYQIGRAVLEMYGVHALEDGVAPRTDLDAADTKKLRKLSRYASIALGLSIGPSGRDPYRPLLSVLGSMGLRLRKDDDGRRVITGVAQVEADSVAYRDRITVEFDHHGLSDEDFDAILAILEAA